jgi:hypothetical protein
VCTFKIIEKVQIYIQKIVVVGENTISPSKIVVTSIIFLQLIFWVMYEHHILNFFFWS